MQSCSFKKISRCLGALLLALCLAVPSSVLAAVPGGINTEVALRTLIENAKDGDVLLVDDIDFESQADPVIINKSITFRSLAERGSAIFSYGTFILDGSAGDISVCFENITFYSAADTALIRDEVWDGDCEAFQPAMTFRGNVDAVLNDCVFRNYMSLEGADLYADYSDSGAKLTLTANSCAFLGSAVCTRGGAALLIGREGDNNVIFKAADCSFAGNLSSNRKDALGGGAIYAENAALDFNGCSFTSNEASHQYLTEDPDAETGDEEAEPVYVKYADRTKGGAVYAKHSNLTMLNCSIAFNSASLGGGLALENSEMIFRDGVIALNRAESSLLRKGKEGLQAETGMGGGIYADADSDLTMLVLNSSFYGNSALNAYGAFYLEGMGTADLPYTLDLSLCTIADNTVDTVYNKVEVPREDYFPKETKDKDKDKSEETGEDEEGEQSEEDKKKAEEEAKKKAEEEAKKAGEAKKKAEEAYNKAVDEATAKAIWDTIPGDAWALDCVNVKASVVIDDSFSSLKRKKVVAFPRYEEPSEINYYSYYAASENALAKGYLPDVPSAEYVHVYATDAFREAFPLPEGMGEEFFAPYFDIVQGDFAPGDNVGEGSMTYQLLFEGAVWKEIEVPECISPDLSEQETEKEGYHFIAWQNPDGSPYQPGIRYYLPRLHETRQVNSIMEPNTYTLYFVSDAGTEEVKQVYGTPVVLPTASDKKDYDFVNWYKDDGTVAEDGEIYLLTRDRTYTAEYTKQFPMKTVIYLSAAIAAVLLYLIIARIVDAVRKKKALKEIAEAEDAAKREAEKKESEGANAAEEAAGAGEAAAQAEAGAGIAVAAAEDEVSVPLAGAEEIYAEEAAAQDAEAALEAAAEAEKAARDAAND